MKKTFRIILLSLLFFSCKEVEEKKPGAPDLQSLIDAENNFAKTARDNNSKDAFIANLNDSSITFSKGLINTHSIDSVKTWKITDSNYLFWWPIVADIASSGDLGYSTGPCEWGVKRAGGPHITGGGYYATVWKRDANGKWKLAVDLGGGILDPADKTRHFEMPLTRAAAKNSAANADPAKEKAGILKYDKDYNDKLNAEKKSFYTEHLASNARLHRSGEKPFASAERINENITIEKDVRFSFEQAGGGVSGSADMAYTFGKARFELVQNGKEYDVPTNYMRVWKKENNRWKIVLDVVQ